MELRQGLQSRTKILHWAGKYDTNYDIGMKNLVTIVEERANLPQSERCTAPVNSGHSLNQDCDIIQSH